MRKLCVVSSLTPVCLGLQIGSVSQAMHEFYNCHESFSLVSYVKEIPGKTSSTPKHPPLVHRLSSDGMERRLSSDGMGGAAAKSLPTLLSIGIRSGARTGGRSRRVSGQGSTIGCRSRDVDTSKEASHWLKSCGAFHRQSSYSRMAKRGKIVDMGAECCDEVDGRFRSPSPKETQDGGDCLD